MRLKDNLRAKSNMWEMGGTFYRFYNTYTGDVVAIVGEEIEKEERNRNFP